MRQKVAKLLIDCLLNEGVEYIFCSPDPKIDAVSEALINSPIKLITCHHEQNAAFMAAAYGRITGKPGVVLVTSDLLTATTAGDPIVTIGESTPKDMEIMAGVAKAQLEILAPHNIPEILMNAFRIAKQPRSGLVFVSIPRDVSKAMTDIIAGIPPAPEMLGPAPEATLRQAASLLNHAKKPVLFLGLEASRPENCKAIRAFLKQHPIPVISTYQGAGMIPRDMIDLFVGHVGLFKNQPGDLLLNSADVILTIGFDPMEYDPKIWHTGKNTIIHLDYCPADLHTDYQAEIELLGDIAATIQALAPLVKIAHKPLAFPSHHSLEEKLETANAMTSRFSAHLAASSLNDKKTTKTKEANKLTHPLSFIEALKGVITDDTTITCDIGTPSLWMARYFLTFSPHQILFSRDQHTLGVALPWAMAATLARPHKKVIAISDNDGFLFSATELETAVRAKMSFVHIVWVDGRESTIKSSAIDYIKFAESLGAKGYRITQSSELLPTLEEALQQKGPVIIEVPMDYRDNPKLFAAAHANLGG